jgi:hypothetical protein
LKQLEKLQPIIPPLPPKFTPKEIPPPLRHIITVSGPRPAKKFRSGLAIVEANKVFNLYLLLKIRQNPVEPTVEPIDSDWTGPQQTPSTPT